MNVGGADGVYTATLTVNGTEVATKDIAVAAGGFAPAARG